jgi:hypothetical protein
MGKGWAKGLTKATDPRVARAAAGHRGLAYERRTPVEDCKWPGSSATKLAVQWSHEMAYIVGLTATDGCLISGRCQINFKSQDRELLETYLVLLGRSNPVRVEATRSGGRAYSVQFGDAKLYRWLESIGLTPRKSLTLGAIDVPDEHLFPLVRGLLDGDGSVINKTYRADTRRRDDYFWEYLQTKFYSASRTHAEWLQSRLSNAAGVRGYLSRVRPPAGRLSSNPMFHLRYGKRESLVLLPLIYVDGAPCLARKRAIWDDYRLRHAIN